MRGRERGEKIPENECGFEFVEEEFRGLWGEQRLVAISSYGGNGPFLAEWPAVRIGRTIEGYVREQDQG